jgi:hypothetical protein
MGTMNRGEIIELALNTAGDSSLFLQAWKWLDNWLTQTYSAWPWPFLQRMDTGISLPAGTASLQFGSANKLVQRIYDPVYLYTSDMSMRAAARIRQLIDGSPDLDEVAGVTSSSGLPLTFRIRASTTVQGAWDLYPWPRPDKNYLLKVEYQLRPASAGAYAGVLTDVPLYPNDETIVQGVLVKALQFISASSPEYLQRYQLEMGILRGMVADDRIAFGQVPGLNDSTALDGGVFK